MSFSARIKKYLDDIRASYWFVPTVLVLFTLFLALGCLAVDRHPHLTWIKHEWMNDLVSAEGARSVVSVIAQSMIGVAGVMFSITMLAVSFASGQYGPRLIGNFMRDRGNQWSLGILISTFTFAMLVLRAIESPQEDVAAFVPHFSIIVSMVLALLSVFVMIFHVHHVPETISASNIVASLGQRFTRQVGEMLERDPSPAPETAGTSHDVFLRTSGYIHNIAQDQLSDIAKEQGWVIEILEPPGEFVHPNRAVLRIWGSGDTPDPDTSSQLRNAVALGLSKTEHQNIVFVAEQLVEIVARAMSPGINDPFTAINCLLWMEAGLAPVARQDKGLAVLATEHVLEVPITFEDLLHRSLGDSMAYVMGDAMARSTALDVLERLAALATDNNKNAIVALINQIRSEA